MSVDDATLIVSIRDEASASANALARNLDRLNVATGGADKSMVKFEQSFANMASKAGILGKSVNSVTDELLANRTALAAAAAQVDFYTAALARLNITQDKNGVFRSANGQFASKAAVAEQIAAQESLTAAQAAYAVESRRNAALEKFNTDATNAHAAANTRLAFSFEEVVSRSTATRYALAGTSRALSSLATGLLALPVASAIVAANYERDFATVERATLVTGKQAESLKASLIDLSKTVPVSFKKITDIAASGAQLGIDPKGLTSFTRVVAELTATTNLSAEAAGNFLGKFAKIAGVDPSQFTNLASSILNVGVHTAATETQIAKLSTQLVGISHEAGFTVPQLVGLSAALASVSSVGPELARGTVTRFIQDMQGAVETGGPALDAFANTAKVSTKTVQEAFGTEKFAPLFLKFMEGLNGIMVAGGSARDVLNEIGIKSVRDIPLLLNLAAGHKTLAEAMKFAADGYNNQTILAQHYSKINDTLVSKVKELGNQFGAFLNQVGGTSTGPLKDVVKFLTDMLKSLGDFEKTNFGQNFTIMAAAGLVLFGVLSLLASGFTKMVEGVFAAIKAYDGLKKMMIAYTAAQEASAAASVTGVSKMSGLLSFLTNPWVLGIAAATAAVVIFVDQLGKLKATDAEVQNALTNAKTGFGSLTSTLSKGQNLNTNPLAFLSGANTKDLFKNFNASIKKEADLTSGSLWDQIMKGFGQGSLKNAQSMQMFSDALGRAGTQLAAVAQNNLPSAQIGFQKFANQTDGTRGSLVNLLNQMPAYKAELTRQLTESGQAANTTNLLALAYGNLSSASMGASSSAQILTSEVKRQAEFQAQLLSSTGMTQKDVDAFGASYQKSIQPLTDFNSIVGQVQQGLQANADALAKQSGQPASTYYDGISVSLEQFTAQLNDNSAKQETWFQNLITVATQYGTDAAAVFIQAGYTATNNSILQQLVDATPAQAQAYIAAQTRAATDAAAATGEALISAGTLVTAAGHTIGQDTATQMGKMLLAGFSPADIMKKFNLQFNANPGVPQVDTNVAQSQLRAFVYQTIPPMVIALTLNTAPANNALANYRAAVNSTSAPNPRVFATGGYTGPGGRLQPAGIVHAGEFVMTADATRRIGVSTLYAMMNGQRGAQSSRPGMGYAGGGLVTGSAFSSIDAQSLKAIYALANRPVILYADSKLLAQSVAEGNMILAYGGSN